MPDRAARAASRRRFFFTTATTTASLAGGIAISRQGCAAANDRVHVCVIGVRGRGRDLLKAFASQPDVTVSHVCDVNEGVLGGALAAVREARAAGQAAEPVTVGDLRKVLDDRSVDAIVVATPDHWHSLATIWGCQAGKHVYVEKPVSNEIFAGRQMVQAARRHGRLVQVGTQSRSAPHYLEAMGLLRSGRIGRVHMAKAWNSQLRRRVPAKPDEAVPGGLDWDLWQGPAPERPYNENRYTYGWRWLWDYGTGDMGNDGVHDLDIARWGLGADHPLRIDCTGGKLQFTDDYQETPDTQYVTFTFPDNRMLVYEQRLWSPYHQEGFENGVAFYGNAGYMLIGRRGWKVVGKGNEVLLDKQASVATDPHVRNFLDAVRSGTPLSCDIEEGYRSSLLAHLGNLSYRVGRPLAFDAAAHTVKNDPEANALVKRPGRKEFVIPETI
jgi:predicted dehydrogenase